MTLNGDLGSSAGRKHFFCLFLWTGKQVTAYFLFIGTIWFCCLPHVWKKEAEYAKQSDRLSQVITTHQITPVKTLGIQPLSLTMSHFGYTLFSSTQLYLYTSTCMHILTHTGLLDSLQGHLQYSTVSLFPVSCLLSSISACRFQCHTPCGLSLCWSQQI